MPAGRGLVRLWIMIVCSPAGRRNWRILSLPRLPDLDQESHLIVPVSQSFKDTKAIKRKNADSDNSWALIKRFFYAVLTLPKGPTLYMLFYKKVSLFIHE